MNEPIVVARVRKETKLVLKPGDFVVVSSPDKNFSEANKAFEEIDGAVNEDYSRVIIAKLQHTRPSKNPLTRAEEDSRLRAAGVADEKVRKIAEGARKRTADAEKENAKKAAKSHSDQLAAANAIAAKVRSSTVRK